MAYEGTALAHYELHERIGSGGMGDVWRACDTKLDRLVALKLLPESFVDDADRHARFHREAQALAAFTHPHVAGIHALEEADGHHFLVMELVEGENLSERLLRGPLPPRVCLEIACQIAMALEAAHAKGIVHRDLKPANIKIDRDDQVKVLDFGLAKVFMGDDPERDSESLQDSPTVTSEMTAAGVILGTAAYMSPEQARGHPVDLRSDIWSFGCVLFEMLTGRQAFGGETLSDTLANILRGEPQWSALPADLHPSLLRLLQRCLNRRPRERLHHIADARLEIDDILQGAGPFVRPPKPVGRRKRVWLLAAAAVAGWLGVGLLGGRLASTTVEESSPVRLRNLTFTGRDWAPDASPDGSVVAFTSNRDGTPRIWLKQVRGGGEAPVTAGSDDRPRFSPDGSQILYVHDEPDGTRDLYRVAVVGGRPRRLMNDVVEADWSPDGSQVAFLRMSAVGNANVTAIGIADVQTGAARILAEVNDRQVYGVRWSPLGDLIAVNETSLTGNVAIESYIGLVDVATGALERIAVTGWQGSYTSVSWAPQRKAFVVGQASDVLAHISGEPGLVMEYEVDSGAVRPIFWAPFRFPRGGWGYSTLAVLDGGDIVLDDYQQYAELHEYDLGDGAGTRAPRQLTASLGRDRQPVYSPDGHSVVFSSNRSGNIDLWQLDRSTGELRQLTDDPANDWDPAFTPDGGNILWSSDRGGHMEIWTAAADGGGARRISDDGEDAENPTMTPDGQWIVYASSHDDHPGIWKIRPDGSEATHLVDGSFLLPEVSPDGRHVLCMMIRSLNFVVMVADLETGELDPFSIEIPLKERNQDVVFGRARWSADGSRILYVGQDENGLSGVYAQDFVPGADTSATRVPLAGFSPLYFSESLGLSPDGTKLTISAMYNRRSLKLADNLELANWD